jgi:hypothetical protein
MCKFIHLRNLGERHETSGKGGKTIAFEVLPHPESDNRLLVKYAVAICNSRENFNRRIAREVSKRRLNSPRHPAQILVVEDGDSIYEALVREVCDV